MTAETSTLKEWAAVVDAVGAGDQVILLRKGGLADRSFGVRSPRFVLMPTYLHQAENVFREPFAHHVSANERKRDDDAQIELSVWCEVARSFALHDLERLLSLRDEVIFSEETIRARFAFREEQAVHVICVRAFRLPAPVVVANERRYGGCRSWLELTAAVPLAGSVQAIAEDELQQRLDRIATAMGVAAAV